MAITLDDEELQRLYTWVDEIPLSRPKKNITRDFSDGVLLAEVVHHYFPKIVELHNYSSANSVRQKMYNWATLNQKVFRRLGFAMDKIEIDTVVNCKPGAVEILLMRLQRHIADIRAGRRAGPSNASPLGANGSAGFAGAISAGAGAEAAAFSQQQYSNAMNAAGPSASTMQSTSLAAVDANIVAEKDATIKELHETIDILELKVKKLEQLVRLKDSRIQTLTARLTAVGVQPTAQ